MSLKNGDIYVKKEALTGYFMVMGFNKKEITLSPLFWCDKILYQTITREELSMYKIHEGQVGHPIVQARYDHEKMRRINKL